MSVPFLLAPMAELSHRALRELVESFRIEGFPEAGPDEYFTEMISAGALVGGGVFESWYVDSGPRPEKLVYQLVGGDEGQLARAAALLDKYECLGIDINMGCSAPAITRSGAGVRWMADIDRAGALIRRIRPQTARRLSVKLRAGLLSGDFEYLLRFCRRLEEEGVELITLHPRTAKEKFTRRAKWTYVSALRGELRIPVAGNGDISSASEMLLRGGECDAVMVGRLALRRPWVFAEARALEARSGGGNVSAEGNTHAEENAPTGSVAAPGAASATENARVAEQSARELSVDIEETALRFLELLSRYQPREFHISRARRFFSYFCDNLKWGNYLKNLLNREADLAGMERVWRGYFTEHPEEKVLSCSISSVVK